MNSIISRIKYSIRWLVYHYLVNTNKKCLSDVIICDFSWKVKFHIFCVKKWSASKRCNLRKRWCRPIGWQKPWEEKRGRLNRGPGQRQFVLQPFWLSYTSLRFCLTLQIHNVRQCLLQLTTFLRIAK